MTQKERADAPCKTSTPVCLLGGSSGYVAESGENSKAKAVLKALSPYGVRNIKADFSRFLHGDPKIAMEWYDNGAIRVGLTAIPWGWNEKAQPQWHADERSAYLHAALLKRELEKAGQAAREYREWKYGR
jgi:hypothetical protein